MSMKSLRHRVSNRNKNANAQIALPDLEPLDRDDGAIRFRAPWSRTREEILDLYTRYITGQLTLEQAARIWHIHRSKLASIFMENNLQILAGGRRPKAIKPEVRQKIMEERARHNIGYKTMKEFIFREDGTLTYGDV